MTSTNSIAKQLVVDALECAELYEAVDQLTDVSYSGRNNKGEPCVAFALEGKRGTMRKLARFAFELGINAIQEQEEAEAVAARFLNALSMDDLGLDMIVYFPGWTLA